MAAALLPDATRWKAGRAAAELESLDELPPPASAASSAALSLSLSLSFSLSFSLSLSLSLALSLRLAIDAAAAAMALAAAEILEPPVDDGHAVALPSSEGAEFDDGMLALEPAPPPVVAVVVAAPEAAGGSFTTRTKLAGNQPNLVADNEPKIMSEASSKSSNVMTCFFLNASTCCTAEAPRLADTSAARLNELGSVSPRLRPWYDLIACESARRMCVAENETESNPTTPHTHSTESPHRTSDNAQGGGRADRGANERERCARAVRSRGARARDTDQKAYGRVLGSRVSNHGGRDDRSITLAATIGAIAVVVVVAHAHVHEAGRRRERERSDRDAAAKKRTNE